MRFIAAACCLLLCVPAHADRRRAVIPAPAWYTSLTITKRNAQTVGASTFYSSASLTAQWNAPSAAIDHYLLTATETAGGAPLTFSAKSSATSATLLYADGATTGDPSLVDFEDWEPIARARRVNYLWPSGTLLSDEEKSMLDDYQIWMPTNDPAFQVIYSNMSCPNNACGAPFIGMAVLLNP